MNDFQANMNEISGFFADLSVKNQALPELKESDKLVRTLFKNNNVDKFLNSENPQFNSIFWAKIVKKLMEEIEFGFCWMKAFSTWHDKNYDPNRGPSGDFFPVGYFADNCITRIHSCRDKIALMVWAFYCSFDPEDNDHLLNYEQIIKRFKKPVKFAIHIEGQKDFLKHLEKLQGKDFKVIRGYRDFIIHRLAPLILMGGIQTYHCRNYRFPLIENDEINDWAKSLKTNHSYDDEMIERTRKENTYDGIQYTSRPLGNYLRDFKEIAGHIESCRFKLFKGFSGCLNILIDRLALERF